MEDFGPRAVHFGDHFNKRYKVLNSDVFMEESKESSRKFLRAANFSRRSVIKNKTFLLIVIVTFLYSLNISI